MPAEMPAYDDGADRVIDLEQCVPAAAVSVPDEGEQLAAPEPGDTVRYVVEGRVTRTDGGHVYVQPTTINGQPVEEAKPEQPVDELATMREEAEGMGY